MIAACQEGGWAPGLSAAANFHSAFFYTRAIMGWYHKKFRNQVAIDVMWERVEGSVLYAAAAKYEAWSCGSFCV